MKAVNLRELWSKKPVQAFLDNNDSYWTVLIRESLPEGTGYVLVPIKNESAFYQSFARKLNVITDEFGSGNGAYPTDYLQLILAFYDITLSGIDDEPLPPALFTTLSAEEFEPYLIEGYLPQDTRISTSIYAGEAFDYDCIAGYAPAAHTCEILYAENDPWMRNVFFEGGDFKNFVLDFIGERFGIFIDPNKDQEGLDLLIRIAITLLISAVISVGLAFLLQPVISALVTNTLKAQAYGDDGYGEKVFRIHPSLDFNDDTIGTLPETVQREMIENSLQDAPSAIHRLRVMLECGELGGEGGVDPMATATKFEKSELIHNAYFHSSLFIKHLAAILIEKHGLTPSDKFRVDQQAMSYRYIL